MEINYYKFPEYLQSYSCEENIEGMEKYMKNKFQFLGIKAPERKKLLQNFVRLNGLPNNNYHEIIIFMFDNDYREINYCALELLEKIYKKNPDKMDIELIKSLIITKSWWDTVDFIASHLVGVYFIINPKNIKEYINKWQYENNIWIQRTCILFQLKYKDKTDEDLLYRICELFKKSDEFFIQKAIGWALREYSKTNPLSVQKFIEIADLKPLSKREGSKYLKK